MQSNHPLTHAILGRNQLDDDGNIIHEHVTCNVCGATWNNAIFSAVTPAPSGRCPYEGEHHKMKESDTITTGPWTDGSEASFKPWTDGFCVGFKCFVNGEVIYVYLAPSAGGDSPDVFLYSGEDGDPAIDAPLRFVGFKPGPNAEALDA